MDTHRNIAQHIIMRGGEYIMALKDNQPALNDLVDNTFGKTKVISGHTTEEKGHGRTERRKCTVIDTKVLMREGMYEEWPGLKRIIRMERERICKEGHSRETIYYLSSEGKDEASYYAGRIRNHWGIENKLHWHLDVTFKEDQFRVRTDNGAVNLSAMRKYAMELLKKQTDKLSLKRRRKKCLLNLSYLAQVLKAS